MAGNIALLVIHGIGAQEPGETLGKLLKGLRRVDQDAAPKTIHDNMIGTVGGQAVRFYEVYWADLLKGDITHDTFRMNELQSLSWFPWFNHRHHNYPPRSYSFLKLLWWWLALPIINFLVLFAYFGATALVQILGGTVGKRKEVETDSRLSQIKRKVFGHGTTLTNLDRLLDEYLGDVFSYVNSAGEAFHRDTNEPQVPPQVKHVYAAIVRRFYDQLVRAQADGCTTIQILAHSLGTVVTYHVLSNFRSEASHQRDAEEIKTALAKVHHVYTIGCPLEKIRFFWPRLTPRGIPIGRSGVRWENFVSWFDPVAGALRSPEDWGDVSNRRLLGGGFVTGHVVYEHNSAFLSALTQGLCGHDIPLKRGLGERLQDFLMLIGETLLAPTVLAFILIVGASLFALAPIAIAVLLSLPVRWFFQPETWAPYVDAASFTILGLMTLGYLVDPVIRARKVHSRYWIVAPSQQRPAAGMG